jgi:multimeric flavodoxin WrbA
LNGSIRGSAGNSAALLDVARRFLPDDAVVDEVVLTDYAGSVEELVERLRASDALLFATGVYWSSWGSPLQRFLEVMTGYELSDCFLGKPAGVLVSMDSVGGLEVAQRLLGVLGMLGCLTPPLASVVVSRAGARVRGQPGFEDVFQVDDIEIVLENLCQAARMPTKSWKTWPITRTEALTGPYPHRGRLPAGLALFPTE